MIERPICLNLPEDYKWLTAKVISASDNVEANLTINDPTLMINSGLLKLNEYIRFQALLQAPHEGNITNLENKLDNIINISHRIADLPKIKFKKLPGTHIFDIFLLISVLLGFIIGILCIGYVGYDPINQNNINQQTIYYFIKSNNEIIKVTIKGLTKDLVTIEGVDKSYKETLNINDFIKKAQRTREEYHKIPFFVKLLGVFVLWLLLYFVSI